MKNKTIVLLFLFIVFLASHSLTAGSQPRTPDVCLSGIMYDAHDSIAVVNGKSLKEGESINNVKVISILKHAVKLEYDGKIIEKKIGDGCLKLPSPIYKDSYKITKAIKQKFSITDKNSAVFDKKMRKIISGYGVAFVFLICFLVIFSYIYVSLCLHKIANKTKTSYGWLAWIPIASTFLLLMIARKSFWWIILLLIPLVNFICMIIIWIKVANARNKPGWLGVLMILPVFNIAVLGYLAFSR